MSSVQYRSLSVLSLLLVLAGAVLYGVQGASLFLSLMTVKDSITQLFNILKIGVDPRIIMLIIVTSLFISEVLKPQFRIRNLPRWANLAVFLGLTSFIAVIPVTGIGYLLQELASIVLSLFAPAFQILQQHAGAGIATFVAAVFLYVIILRFVMGKLLGASGYDMWTSGLFASSIGYVAGIFLGVFAYMTISIIRQLMSIGSVLFLVIGLVMIGTAIHDALSNLKFGVHDLVQLPAIIMICLEFRNVFGTYSWMIDMFVITMTMLGISCVVAGVLLRNKGMYVAGCAFSSSLLATLTMFSV